MKKIELLSPAGSYESMVAAVNAGCDAVYTGGAMFGARASAHNLNQEEVLAAIDYMHLREKKIYLTVNTLLKDHEIEEKLYEYLLPYYERGLDAVIAQDAGVIRFIHQYFADLPIHASTQMTLTMAGGAEVLMNQGVTRIVTSRELSLEEIKNIRTHTSLEIESFVHGALCYSYSGQCLMSSMIGGRSGNRGRCAQPCRMPYRLDGTQSYLLSPKDMCTIDLIPDLMESGIDSFKIEGRMKRHEYVAGVTSIYRTHIDLYEQLGKKGYMQYCNKHKDRIQEQLIELKDLYNRGGFCSGYYQMHNGSAMMSTDRPNHSGVYIGDVIKIFGDSMEIVLREEVNTQDVLEVRNAEKAVYEYTIKEGMMAGGTLISNFKHGSTIQVGSKVYRTKNNQLLTALSGEYYNKKVRLPITGCFYAKAGEPVVLTLSKITADGNDIGSTVYGEVAEKAVKQPVTIEKIKTQLNKLSDTLFYFESLDVQIYGDIFVPIGMINQIRREAVSQLEQAILHKDWREKHSLEAMMISDLESAGIKDRTETIICVSVNTIEQLTSVLETGQVDEVYYDITDADFSDVKQAALLVKKIGIPLFITFPHIFRERTCRFYIENIDSLLCDGITGYMIRNFETYWFLAIAYKEQFKDKEIRSDSMLYTMNRQAKHFYSELGIQRMTAPLELNKKELRRLDISDMELICYGSIPLMVTAQCVRSQIKGCESGNKSKELLLYDRKDKELRVETHCQHCYSTIYDNDRYSLFDSIDEIKELNPKSIRLIFTNESRREVQSVLRYLNHCFINDMQFEEKKEYTRGHFKRGIL